jgi:hypothetical protein
MDDVINAVVCEELVHELLIDGIWHRFNDFIHPFHRTHHCYPVKQKKKKKQKLLPQISSAKCPRTREQNQQEPNPILQILNQEFL